MNLHSRVALSHCAVVMSSYSIRGYGEVVTVTSAPSLRRMRHLEPVKRAILAALPKSESDLTYLVLARRPLSP